MSLLQLPNKQTNKHKNLIFEFFLFAEQHIFSLSHLIFSIFLTGPSHRWKKKTPVQTLLKTSTNFSIVGLHTASLVPAFHISLYYHCLSSQSSLTENFIRTWLSICHSPLNQLGKKCNSHTWWGQSRTSRYSLISYPVREIQSVFTKFKCVSLHTDSRAMFSFSKN